MANKVLANKLIELWKNYYSHSSYLQSIEISEDSEALRGIKNSILNFKFPITVLTGKNGSGKTTFLALSILGFHASVPPYYSNFSNDYYDFNFFFPTTLKDRHPEGIKINYSFFESHLAIIKGKERWMRYIKNNKEPKRPLRGTEFIGISRILPAFEKKNYKSYFTSHKKILENKHKEELVEYMQKVVEKPYTSLSILQHVDSTGAHTLNAYNNLHTSFNAGAGEECLMAILSTLLNCEDGSIVAIEEIEIGLHPSALNNLIDVLMEITLKKKLQLVITSHSPEFLRSCPSESLMFLNRNSQNIDFIHRPNVEYVIKSIGGHSSHSISIFCEDNVAKALITNILPSKIKSISSIVAYGGKSELIGKADIIRKSYTEQKIIIIWDGEVECIYLTDASEKGYLGLKLPGVDEPEQYLLNKLNTEKGKDFLLKKYEFTMGEIEDILNQLSILDDIHDIPYKYGLSTQKTKEEAIYELTTFVSENFREDFDDMKFKISEFCNC